MSAPEKRTRCTCGHFLDRHGRYGTRACREGGCACTGLQKVPPARCGNCGHPPSFRKPRPGGGYKCRALGCTCVAWSPQTTEESPPSPEEPPQIPEEPMGAVASTATVVARTGGRNLAVTFPALDYRGSVRVKFRSTGEVEVLMSRR